MANRIPSPLASLVVAALVAGCAGAPWQPPAYQTAIKDYYEAHATEKNGQCLAPYIDGFTRVDVVEDTPQRMVVDARYLYRDWRKQGGGGDDQAFGECIGYGERSFVLTRTDDRLVVTEMSGQRHN